MDVIFQNQTICPQKDILPFLTPTPKKYLLNFRSGSPIPIAKSKVCENI